MTSSAFEWDRLMTVVSLTDIGLRRANNQDAYAVSLASSWEDWLERGHLLVVADGMGAHAAGELASRLTVDQVTYLFRKYREHSPTDALLMALREANAEVHRRGQANLSFHNMGTTCSTLLLLPQGAIAAHVGDSRVYRCRAGQLEQLTFDHSLVWEMQQAAKDPKMVESMAIPKNVITRSIGPHAQVKVDLEGPYPLAPDDTFLLCSDGLTGRVEDCEIASALTHLRPPQAASLLQNLAVLRGGPDNITLIIVRIESDDLRTRGTAVLAPSITSENPQAAPAERKRISVVEWVAVWLLVLLTATFLVTENWLASAISGLLALIALTIVLGRAVGLLGDVRQRLTPGESLGNGPYTQVRSESLAAFTERLREQIEEAGRMAAERGWVPSGPASEAGATEDAGTGREAGKGNDALSGMVRQLRQLADLCRQYV